MNEKGIVINKLRQANGWSFGTLARLSKVNVHTIYKIVAGDRIGTITTLEKIVTALKIKMSEFYRLVEKEKEKHDQLN